MLSALIIRKGGRTSRHLRADQVVRCACERGVRLALKFRLCPVTPRHCRPASTIDLNEIKIVINIKIILKINLNDIMNSKRSRA